MCNQTTKSQWLELSPILAPVARNFCFSLLPFVSFSTLCVKRRGAHSVISDRRTRCYLPPFFVLIAGREQQQSDETNQRLMGNWIEIVVRGQLYKTKIDAIEWREIIDQNFPLPRRHKSIEKKKKTLNSYTIIIRWLMTRNWSGNSLSLKRSSPSKLK